MHVRQSQQVPTRRRGNAGQLGILGVVAQQQAGRRDLGPADRMV